MLRPAITYNLHDAVLVTIRLAKEDRLVLAIELYPLYYPDESTVHLTFSGITNAQEVATFHRAVTALASPEGRLGYRIDAFKYAGDTSFKGDQVGLYLAVDHLQPLVIWCRKYRFSNDNT